MARRDCAWAGHGVCFQCEAGLEPFLAALACDPSRPGQDVLRVQLREGGETPFTQAEPAWRTDARWAAHEQLRVKGAGGSRILFDPYSRSVTSYDPGTSTAELWIESMDGAPSWVRAAPALQLLDWWSLDHGMLATHAAAVAFGHRAVLLLGPGGSGKSTLAVEAAVRGHGFLGDDYVLLEPGRPSRVHGMYRSAKIAEHGSATPPRPPFRLAFPSRDEEKAVLLIDEADFVASAPLAAVVVPRVRDGDGPVLSAISPAEAVRLASPSILRQMPGSEPKKLALLVRGIGDCPCFSLDLARDHGSNIGALEQLVWRLAREDALA